MQYLLTCIHHLGSFDLLSKREYISWISLVTISLICIPSSTSLHEHWLSFQSPYSSLAKARIIFKAQQQISKYSALMGFFLSTIKKLRIVVMIQLLQNSWRICGCFVMLQIVFTIFSVTYGLSTASNRFTRVSTTCWNYIWMKDSLLLDICSTIVMLLSTSLGLFFRIDSVQIRILINNPSLQMRYPRCVIGMISQLNRRQMTFMQRFYSSKKNRVFSGSMQIDMKIVSFPYFMHTSIISQRISAQSLLNLVWAGEMAAKSFVNRPMEQKQSMQSQSSLRRTRKNSALSQVSLSQRSQMNRGLVQMIFLLSMLWRFWMMQAQFLYFRRVLMSRLTYLGSQFEKSKNHGSCRRCEALGLFPGYLLKHFRRNYWHSLETSGKEGWSSWTIRKRAGQGGSQKQGGFPVKSQIIVQPKLQMSQLVEISPLFSIISGAIQYGVPIMLNVLLSPVNLIAPPKSASFTIPSFVSRIFAPLISLCTTPIWCRQSNPSTTCFTYTFTNFSFNDTFFTKLARLPPQMYSRMIQRQSSAWMASIYLTMCLCSSCRRRYISNWMPFIWDQVTAISLMATL